MGGHGTFELKFNMQGKSPHFVEQRINGLTVFTQHEIWWRFCLKALGGFVKHNRTQQSLKPFEENRRTRKRTEATDEDEEQQQMTAITAAQALLWNLNLTTIVLPVLNTDEDPSAIMIMEDIQRIETPCTTH